LGNDNTSDNKVEVVCTPGPGASNNYCVGKEDLHQWTSLITRIWRGAVMILEGYDNYYTGQYIPTIVEDIIGPSPGKCNPNLGPNFGRDGFKRRIETIAVAMSEA
jgi:hypothetical protein